jgi:hypothetical protein
VREEVRRRRSIGPAGSTRAPAARADGGRAASLGWTLLLAAVLAPLAALAHGGDSRVRPVLGDLPPELAGVRVEVHRTVAPQLVLHNPTGHTIEVLDPEGVAFLRVGPRGTEGNLAARAWYTTYGPGMKPPETLDASAPRWVRARAEPTFGWFEPRIDASDIVVPPPLAQAGRPADLGRFEIPLHVDGRPIVLAGSFRFEPAPSGAYAPKLTSPADLAPGVRVRLLPGRNAGLFVESSSPHVLTVLDEAGAPFLRIGPEGVDANVASAAWRRSGRGTVDAVTAAGGTAAWRRVSSSPRFGWIDPRAGHAKDAVPSDCDATETWQVPMQLGDRPLHVTGEVAWRNAPTAN